MRAVLVHPSPSGGRLELTEVPDPRPAAGQVVIAVRAASVNRADLLIRRGTYDARGTALPVGGLDCAGEVLEARANFGERANRFRFGRGRRGFVRRHTDGGSIRPTTDPPWSRWESSSGWPRS